MTPSRLSDIGSALAIVCFAALVSLLIVGMMFAAPPGWLKLFTVVIGAIGLVAVWCIAIAIFREDVLGG